MKKIIGLTILAGAIGATCFAQQIVETYVIKEWIGTIGTTAVTQYIGEARTTENSVAIPNISNAIWKITKKTYETNGLPLTVSVARPASGDSYLSIWTNRVNATYNYK